MKKLSVVERSLLTRSRVRERLGKAENSLQFEKEMVSLNGESEEERVRMTSDQVVTCRG